MRALAASPLFMGGCLIRTEQRVFDFITDRDMLACDQNGVCGSLQSQQESIEVWRTPKSGNPAQGWIGIFNRNPTQTVTYTSSSKDIGLPKGNYRFRNIWTNEVFVPDTPVIVAAEDVIFLEDAAKDQ